MKKKNGDTFYGCKNHVVVGAKSEIIGTYNASNTSVHDSQAMDLLLNEKDKGRTLYADSTYTGSIQSQLIPDYKMINNVHEKGYRNKPLTVEQKSNNTIKSKIRVRLEHIFCFMEQSMNCMYIWSVGMPRATATIWLINLT